MYAIYQQFSCLRFVSQISSVISVRNAPGHLIHPKALWFWFQKIGRSILVGSLENFSLKTLLMMYLNKYLDILSHWWSARFCCAMRFKSTWIRFPTDDLSNWGGQGQWFGKNVRTASGRLHFSFTGYWLWTKKNTLDTPTSLHIRLFASIRLMTNHRTGAFGIYETSKDSRGCQF